MPKITKITKRGIRSGGYEAGDTKKGDEEGVMKKRTDKGDHLIQLNFIDSLL